MGPPDGFSDQQKAKQEERADKGAKRIEQKGRDLIGCFCLRDERHTPDQGGEAKDQTAFDILQALFFFSYHQS